MKSVKYKNINSRSRVSFECAKKRNPIARLQYRVKLFKCFYIWVTVSRAYHYNSFNESIFFSCILMVLRDRRKRRKDNYGRVMNLMINREVEK